MPAVSDRSAYDTWLYNLRRVEARVSPAMEEFGWHSFLAGVALGRAEPCARPCCADRMRESWEQVLAERDHD